MATPATPQVAIKKWHFSFRRFLWCAWQTSPTTTHTQVHLNRFDFISIILDPFKFIIGCPLHSSFWNIKLYDMEIWNICKTHFQWLLHLTGSVFQCSWTVCGWGTSEKILVDPWRELRSYRGYHCRFLTSSDEILVWSRSLLQSHDHLRWME